MNNIDLGCIYVRITPTHSCVARSIARGVYEARAEAGDMKPCWRTRFR